MQERQQIPIELSFTIDNSSKGTSTYRDPFIPNRYWFKFPAEIQTSTARERMIGFRSLWISRSKRNPMIRFDFKKTGTRWSDTDMWKDYDEENERSMSMYAWMDNSEDWLKFYDSLDRAKTKAFGADFGHDALIFDWKKMAKNHDTNVVARGKYWCAYDHPPLQSSDYSYTLHFETGPNFKDDVTFQMSLINEDSRQLFNGQDLPLPSELAIYARQWDFYDVWDRHSHFLTSDLSSSTNGSYLGYSGTRYNPMKYYRITGDFNNF
jgi:hypothetical protein